jgi:hypothetical protein
MQRRGKLPRWTTAADDVCREVRLLLDDFGFRHAFTQTWGDLEAGRRIGQLEAFLHALEVELSFARPERSLVKVAAAALGAGLALSGGKAVDLVTADVYEAITGAQHKAEHVVQCVDEEVEKESEGFEVDVGPPRVVRPDTVESGGFVLGQAAEGDQGEGASG